LDPQQRADPYVEAHPQPAFDGSLPSDLPPATEAQSKTQPVNPLNPGKARWRRAPWPLVPVVAVSLVSASLASVGTAALLRPSGTGASNSAASTSTTTSVVHLDSSEAVVEVAAKVSPAVVTITSSSVNTRFGPFSVPATGVGSGFIFDANGYILTNWHVVEGGGTLTVTLKDGRDLAARVVASDSDKDLAVVNVDATNLLLAQSRSTS